MHRIEKYNRILGITSSVNSEELRRIYRQRAKVLHPDKNQDIQSHDEFVLLGEAYEFYRQLLKQAENEKRDAFFKSKKYPERYYTETWNIEKRKAARKKAAARARIKYEMFERKGYYKKLEKLFFFLEVIRFIAALVVLGVMPVFLFYQDQFRGLIIALFVQLITYKLWSRPIKRFLHFK